MAPADTEAAQEETVSLSPQDTVTPNGGSPPVEAAPDATEFVFNPADGSDPITVPAIQTAFIGRHRWMFWKLRRLQGLEQPIFWLDQAGIPDVVQERIMLLPDLEWGRFFDEWMHRGAGASLGE